LGTPAHGMAMIARKRRIVVVATAVIVLICIGLLLALLPRSGPRLSLLTVTNDPQIGVEAVFRLSNNSRQPLRSASPLFVRQDRSTAMSGGPNQPTPFYVSANDVGEILRIPPGGSCTFTMRGPTNEGDWRLRLDIWPDADVPSTASSARGWAFHATRYLPPSARLLLPIEQILGPKRTVWSREFLVTTPNQSVQRTGASRLRSDRSRTSSAAGSRR